MPEVRNRNFTTNAKNDDPKFFLSSQAIQSGFDQKLFFRF
jgi:hypothetical protein